MAHSGGGGSATSGGMSFQHRVGAWLGVRILAETDTPPLWDYPSSSTLEYLSCEVSEAVDDIRIVTSSYDLVYVQAKRTLYLSAADDSEMASAFDQFARIYIDSKKKTTAGPRPWDRPLDPFRDRLLLAVGPGSSSPICVHLKAVLDRLRTILPIAPMTDAGKNQDEIKALNVAVSHIQKAWVAAIKAAPTDRDIRDVLSLIRVHVIDCEPGGREEQDAKLMLRTTILRNPVDADNAWSQIISFVENLATEKKHVDRVGLQKLLIRVGISLKTIRS